MAKKLKDAQEMKNTLEEAQEIAADMLAAEEIRIYSVVNQPIPHTSPAEIKAKQAIARMASDILHTVAFDKETKDMARSLCHNYEAVRFWAAIVIIRATTPTGEQAKQFTVCILSVLNENGL